MSAWHGSLQLDYRAQSLRGQPRTVLHDLHDGPLRVLASLYPEGPSVCHNVLVHPPGGLVGGDELAVRVTLAPHCHALITTPGATRCYRTTGAAARQTVRATLAPGARLEWLPLETIAYSGCIAENHLQFELQPGAEMIGWDVLALGLPASGLAFERGRYTQSIELPGLWLERGHIDSQDLRLLESPLGWAGHRVMATLWFACGQAMAPARRDGLLEAARQAGVGDPLQRLCGATALRDRVVVLRVLAPRVEPAMAVLTRAWAAWRSLGWDLEARAPRVWRT